MPPPPGRARPSSWMASSRRLPGSRRDEAIQELASARPGGGGIYIHDGLAEAERYIAQSSKPVRHIVAISDGGDTEQQDGALDLVRRLRDQQVTLTSIAVGDGEHVPFIREMARLGGGRTFLTDKAANIPAILADEAQAVIQPYIVEGDFTPALGAPHPILRGLEAAPKLKGYVISTPKQAAQVLLALPRGDPVLAAWQYGLGRALAWTSDLKGQWGAEWIGWNRFPLFGARLLGWLLPPRGPQNLALQASSAGAELILTAQAQDALGQPQAGLRMAARLISSDSSTDVVLREVGPGQYRAAVSGARPGAYLVQLTARDARGQPFGAVTAGAVVPQSAEYRSRGANLALLEALAQATGGRVAPAPAAAFDRNGASQGAVRPIGVPLLWLALLLLPLDVALRRLLLAPAQLGAVRRGLGLGRRRTEDGGRKTDDQRPMANDQGSDVRTYGRPTNPTQNSKLKTQNSGGKPQNAKLKAQNSDLERLREAQERARRRARGEE